MRHPIPVIAVAAALLVSAAVYADEDKPNRAERGVKKAAKAVEKAVERPAKFVEKTAKRTGKAMERAADKTENWIKRQTD
jgi:hypothetical protein